MDLTPYVSSLNSALVTSAQTSSPEVREAAERLAQGMEPAIRLTFMEMASDVAAEVTARLDGDVIDVRLRGGNPEIVVDRASVSHEGPTTPFGTPPEPPAPPAPPQPPVDDDGGMSRISLRLPDYLKSQVDEAAAAEGVSVNTWLVRAIQQALTPQSGIDITTPGGRVRIGRSMTGWVR
ncbi:toxin-antitoxin system HicB family antitoxin [Pseudactinotalea suaedae]|uniref:toxin-antitoxin system HicB family antitoxin n=1 Tax=Pseudactinotalea suaedae TaxID=1524924 RepID=UPI0019D4F7F1|nr:toxin-antitoxin system HicB family antitoxin [Pseudactinotalea suaedae]